MKRISSILLALCILLSLIPITASASDVEASGECSGMNSSVFWSLTSDGTLTISGTGKMRDYEAGYILPPWPSRHDIYTVIVDEGITQIGNTAFYGLKNATTFSLPESLVSIGRESFACHAFERCENLVTITLPANLTHLGSHAFKECFSLKSIHIPDGVTEIGDEAFFCCYALTEVTLPANLEYIYPRAFYGTALKEISFPETLKSISEYAFQYCDFTEVVIPSSVTEVGPYAFYSCNYLTSVQLSENVTSIQRGTFGGCSSLKSIDLPDTLSSIGDYAFQYCCSLENMAIPSSVTSLGSGVFWNCDSLNELTFIGNPPEFAEDTFQNYSGIIRYPDNNSNWTSEVMQKYGGDVTWVAYAHDHSWETQIVEPTCTEQGYTTYTCSVCNDSYTDAFVAATGHSFGTGTEITVPTCTDKGSEVRSCACGESETLEIDALGHSWADPNASTKTCSRCGYTECKYRIPLLTEEFGTADSVWIDGIKYSVTVSGKTRYVDLDHADATNLVVYTYNDPAATDVHTQYPIGMKVWTLNYENEGYHLTYVNEFENLLQYSGSSIRITGNKGIRMITSITKANKNALTTSNLAGYTLLEYGTALAWASDLEGGKPLVLGQPYTKSNYAYKKGVADPVFKDTGTLVQYTNVLVGFDDDKCIPDIAMRPYIILKDASGNEVTIYGGIIYRSIGYIAYQNRNTFQAKSNSYEYVWGIIHHVYGKQFDTEYKG